jgi:23S rRNA (cytidine1920-2'-O)/16S rRNA (cytidine1409-2'-O)-methyltransferase
LDSLLVDRGLFPSREQAAAAILAGRVTVAGRRGAAKPGMRVPADAQVAVRGPAHPYVGRGGQKLAAALDAFGIDPSGRVALDVGASTGGFTDCLLQRGAARVYAVDVGYGQLAWRLRTDPRVVSMERVNARYLRPGDLPEPVDLATVDVAFISLGKILPAVTALLREDGDVVALCKPQFEAGPADVPRGGVVRDPAVHAAVLRAVCASAAEVGWPVVAGIVSPIAGADGNREFLLHLRRRGRGNAVAAEELAERLAAAR